MIVPPSMEITKRPPGAEFWFELEDGDGTPLYRRTQRNPLGPWVEVQTDNPEGRLAQVDSGLTEGEFTLLVPSLPEARALVLYEWALPEDAVEIAKIPEWEWPMRFEAPENVVETVVDGVVVTLSEEVLRIDDLEIELENAIE